MVEIGGAVLAQITSRNSEVLLVYGRSYSIDLVIGIVDTLDDDNDGGGGGGGIGSHKLQCRRNCDHRNSRARTEPRRTGLWRMIR
jgi:hypothetical protein